jgi:hypothetical protein
MKLLTNLWKKKKKKEKDFSYEFDHQRQKKEKGKETRRNQVKFYLFFSICINYK